MKQVIFSGLIFVLIACSSQKKKSDESIELFSLDKVKLLDGPFKEAQQTDLKYILELDADKLLAPFLIDAGLEPIKPGYGNWEGTGLNGHIGGHYLSALAMMYSATRNDSIKKRLDYAIDWLEKCQQANGNGYVGGIPNGKRIWEEISAGEIQAESFSLNGGWVPLYNIHKIFAGLKDAYVYTSNEKALLMWKNLSDWWINTTKQLTEEQFQLMLKSEHGGINEVFADLFSIEGDSIYLEMARKMSHSLILDPLLNEHDSLTGLHANTQIPKVVGFLKAGMFSGDTSWTSASDFFWKTVAQNRSIAFGGNSVREHFNPIDNFSSMLESEQGPETCNTYNMLRLTKGLWEISGLSSYIDFYERALYNHILSSQHPGGGFVYFTPIRPNHYRVYSQPHQGMWCCVGSGMENHAKYGEIIYAHRGDDVLVNLFIASELDWSENEIHIKQSTRFPFEEESTLLLKISKPKKFNVLIRVPNWIAGGKLLVSINDEEPTEFPSENGYAVVNRTWYDGDKVAVKLPMKITTEQLPDKSSWVSFLYGPVVLVAKTDTTALDGLFADDSRMGHVAGGRKYPLENTPVLIGSPENLSQKLTAQIGEESLVVSMTGLALPESYRNLKLTPFYQIHGARYIMYWPYSDSTQ
ncbi:MAG: glycoside hydrolase family 127 protein [Cyclobacteriaceae bacterium]|nr:glycoside hydrolase family 127 protein [Cyclobacteriaceae bacterium]UYN85757.1 MAG: glycoside hydrolase family 127 protein [Cyclobacteriaceae bacterium]